MQVQVNTNKLVAKSRDYINENEYNIHEVNFDFAEEYTDNLVKVALFSNNGNTYKVIIANNKCDIPTEILQKKSTFILGVYAYETQNDELVLRYSPSPITLFVSAGSYIPDEETENSEPITPSELEQYQQALQDGLSEVSGTIESMTDLIDEVQTKLDNGDFNGADGRDGQDGQDGYTPIKGVDYFTEQDKQEIAGLVDVPVNDVQIDGTSIVQDGVANVPIASANEAGVVKIHGDYGLATYLNFLQISKAEDYRVKAGASQWKPIVPYNQHEATFYGLAKAAGDTTQSQSSNAVGTYTEDAKSAISEMLGSSISISGTTPTIVAKSGIRYVCGEVATLDFTPSQTGICDVVFTSGSTPTVVTLPSTVKFPDGSFTPEADTTYEINILDGIYGGVMAWT